ncbi:hypothetical protein F4703DRAFT_1774394 [Phycomyces blakesleeanus]
MYFDEFSFTTESDNKLFEYLRDKETLPAHSSADKLEWDIIVPVLSSPNVIQLVVHISISLTSSAINLTIPSLSNPWLNRDTQERLSREAQTAIQQHTTDPDLVDRASCLIEVLQHTRDAAEPLALTHIQELDNCKVQAEQGPVMFVREWIWFPMIYTREKTLSWADIPASHRKMTSRWQQKVTCEPKDELEKQRLFKDMTEVTFELHGAFGNHNNLNMLSDWMKSKGCGDAFYHLFEYEE